MNAFDGIDRPFWGAGGRGRPGARRRFSLPRSRRELWEHVNARCSRCVCCSSKRPAPAGFVRFCVVSAISRPNQSSVSRADTVQMPRYSRPDHPHVPTQIHKHRYVVQGSVAGVGDGSIEARPAATRGLGDRNNNWGPAAANLGGMGMGSFASRIEASLGPGTRDPRPTTRPRGAGIIISQALRLVDRLALGRPVLTRMPPPPACIAGASRIPHARARACRLSPPLLPAAAALSPRPTDPHTGRPTDPHAVSPTRTRHTGGRSASRARPSNRARRVWGRVEARGGTGPIHRRQQQ